MDSYVLLFNQVGRSSLSIVGGKGANLGELSQAGFPVPGGFCVTTQAYQEMIATSPEMESLLESLNATDPNDLQEVRRLGAYIRSHIQQLDIPDQIDEAIGQAWHSVGPDYAYAIRSSATAEDLPTASFAGQQDTYLNVKGKKQVIEHIRMCWASLFTDRAIVYRAKNGFDHRNVYLSVVVQRMVQPDISGILFTADPINGNRHVVSIDASFGLGEAIVSGMVSADLYKVKAEQIIERKIAAKHKAIYSLPEGGTVTEELPRVQQTSAALTDNQILKLAKVGKSIEQHFGSPQDIEFCIENEQLYIVQSRPITSLYPLPDIPQEPLRVLFSFGHFQMMTDPIKPLGISVIKTLVPIPLHYFWEIGGRVFIDLSEILRHKIGRKIFPRVFENMDEAASRAIREVSQRPAFLATPVKRGIFKIVRGVIPVMKEVRKNLLKRDPKAANEKVNVFIQKKWTEVRDELQRLRGASRLEAVQFQCRAYFKYVIPNIFHYVISFMISNIVLKNVLTRWIGDDNELHQLNKSLPGNVTSEMGLEIGDLADLVRKLPEVEEYIKTADNETFYEGLATVCGGEQFKSAMVDFLALYGSRCAGEIDLTRPRWRESPVQLVPAILGHIRSVQPGEHRNKYVHGEQEAREAEERIMYKLRRNRLKRKIVRRLIDVYRYLGGLREHHKYLLTLIFDECKQAIISEAEELVRKGILQQVEEAYFLTVDELIQLSKGQLIDDVAQLIAERIETYEWQKTLKPPRVMTSEGEIVTVAREGDFPQGALVGSPVSTGIAEGKARVILQPDEASLHEGEILVAPGTDPGWTPLFQSARALVTEVGGLMTHGSVVAREYGIPAAVGVEDATKKIKTGQRIRVNGDQGFVEILSDEK